MNYVKMRRILNIDDVLGIIKIFVKEIYTSYKS
jgi:hypothetical protein